VVQNGGFSDQADKDRQKHPISEDEDSDDTHVEHEIDATNWVVQNPKWPKMRSISIPMPSKRWVQRRTKPPRSMPSQTHFEVWCKKWHAVQNHIQTGVD
jgi:hypothetical protein